MSTEFWFESQKGTDQLVKVDLREIKFGGVDWIHLAQDRNRWPGLMNTVVHYLLD
jgi:hypothetical protein